ncbi:hypothetical protein F2P56_033198 [Juglans regia]|uniref:Holliday junction resolvase MOC1, chloroplastic-like isoform X3 n=2 Tax=Juglans regia TaxID=51240 RepID=A0A2I4FN55_JUGRE|nr:Holliday junction resolvase MOC1, chloroplastic-like isoform X3 [Juglans regia]KAF5447665.1 hypothetical protein F2P56_033198 [Juglans regia]
MEALQMRQGQQLNQPFYMNSPSSKLKQSFSSFKLRAFFCTSLLSPLNSDQAQNLLTQPPILTRRKSKNTLSSNGVAGRAVKFSDAQLKENWLDSLTCPFPDIPNPFNGSWTHPASDWVLGIDPDIHGALALLKSVESGSSAQVFDSPHLQVLVGKRVRRRLDAKSIVQLLRSLDAPSGVVEWRIWVWAMDWDLSCLRIFCCSSAFYAMEKTICTIRREVYKGRAEALLIAAYGQGLKKLNSSCISEELELNNGKLP